MKVLIVDTETTGKILQHLPFSDPSQPHVLELGAELLFDWQVQASLSLLVDPGDDVDISAEITGITGIDRDLVMAFGVPEKTAMTMFYYLMLRSDMIVAHNLDFDHSILQISLMRSFKDPRPLDSLLKMKRFCTMLATENICKIPGKWKGKFKWPSLKEAYTHIVGDPDGIDFHRARNDVKACREILKRLYTDPQYKRFIK